MDLQQAASVLGADHIEWLLKRPITIVKNRFNRAVEAEHFYNAAALYAVIERMESQHMTNNPNAPKVPPKREPKVVQLNYEASYGMDFLEAVLEKVLTGQALNHEEQTIWDLAFDIAIAQRERAGQ